MAQDQYSHQNQTCAHVARNRNSQSTIRYSAISQMTPSPPAAAALVLRPTSIILRHQRRHYGVTRVQSRHVTL